MCVCVCVCERERERERGGERGGERKDAVQCPRGKECYPSSGVGVDVTNPDSTYKSNVNLLIQHQLTNTTPTLVRKLTR